MCSFVAIHHSKFTFFEISTSVYHNGMVGVSFNAIFKCYLFQPRCFCLSSAETSSLFMLERVWVTGVLLAVHLVICDRVFLFAEEALVVIKRMLVP